MVSLKLNPDAISKIMGDAMDKVGKPAAERMAKRMQATANERGIEITIEQHHRHMRRGGIRPVLTVGSGNPATMALEAETGFISRARTGA